MPRKWSILDIDSGCVNFFITLSGTSFFTLYKYFVIFVCWFLLVISKVCTKTLNQVIINKQKKSLLQSFVSEKQILIVGKLEFLPHINIYSKCLSIAI